MLPDSVCTSSEVLQPSSSHPSLSTHIFWHGSSSAGDTVREKEIERGEDKEENSSTTSGLGDGL